MFEGPTFALDVEIRAGADKIAVFFPHRWATRRAMEREYGAKFAEKYGLNALLVRSNGPDWFQADDFEEMAEVIGLVCRNFRHTTFTGSSMGGYGAIRAAEFYPAELVIAFSPISNIDPGVFPYETGFKDDYDDARPFYVPREHCAGRYRVFYDSVHRDRQHVENFALPGNRTDRVPIPCSGHQTSKIIADAGLLSRITRDLMDGRNIAGDVATLRRAKRGQPTYLLSLFRKNVRRRPAVAAWAVAEMQARGYFPDRMHRFLRQLPDDLRPTG
ncbi:MAG: hypothetical protein AAFP13_09910 [Pseudomonadota bacterium]